MAGAENILEGIEAMSEMVEQLGKSLDEMESHRESLLNTKSLLKDIKQYFHDTHKSLQQKFEDLAAKEAAVEEKKSEHCRLITEREAAIATKEQALWERLQVLKDAAVSAVIEARKKHKEASPVLENKVSSLAPDGNIPVNKLSTSTEAITGKVKPLHQMKQLCEQMNFMGLMKFFAENRKLFPTIREELPHALRSAYEPARLVLDALEGFYPQNQSNSNPNSNCSNLQVMRRSCILLMESAASLLGMDEPGCNKPVSSEIKQRAEVIAGEWKPKLAEVDLDASNGFSLEAQAFLQLLATFSVSSGFDEDELCRLVVAMSRRRRQAPELCRALGLAHKVKDIVAGLVSKGRQIDAVHFSHDFQLTEMFPFVPLLKQYLEDAKENPAAKDSAAAEELMALKSVMKCIEVYKLYDDFPPDSLKQRIIEIEKDKANKKRATQDSSKAPKKKPWTDRGRVIRVPFAISGDAFRPITVYDERARYVDRYPAYGHQASAPRPYHQPYGSSSSYGGYGSPSAPPVSGNYGNYVGSGMQSQSPANFVGYMGGGDDPSYQSYM